MVPNLFDRRIPATIAAVLLWNVAGTAFCQQISAPLDSGFARTSSIDMSVDEMLGSRKVRPLFEEVKDPVTGEVQKKPVPILGPGYPKLWIAEVQFKPVRLMRLDLRDPQTGVVRKELVRYLVYRFIQRDPTELAGSETAELRRKLADPNVDPANGLDPEFTKPLQTPRFILKTEDNNSDELYVDEISPEIQKAVFQREFGRRGLDLKMLNSVEAIAEVGEPVPRDDKDALSKAVYGVAVWRNVDPRADFFTVIMSGFSNAYRISSDENGNHTVEEKVIVQRFARPGDEFNQDEQEFRFINDLDTDGDGTIDVRYPNWQYQVREAKLNIDNMDSVLRNTKVSFVESREAAPAAGNTEAPAPQE